MRGKVTDSQLNFFDKKAILPIPITFVEQLDWIFVRRVKPKRPEGAKALKNEDFKDKEYWPEMYARAAQREAFYRKYRPRTNNTIYAAYMDSNDMAISQRVTPITHTADKPFEYIPTVLDKYASKTDYTGNLENSTVELLFTGPLENPMLRNRTSGKEIQLYYSLAVGQESTLYICMDNAIGDLIYRFANMTVLWELLLDRNTLELFASKGMEDGGSLKIAMAA